MISVAFFGSHSISDQANTATKLSTTVDSVIGQVLLSWLAEKFSRKRMYDLELITILFGIFW
ncbi:phosphate:h symporter [Lasallia pustulata]|uniref:Phosphate:h symporter n=1 Tax=Lasallia pustulata TaxID=136370 RepID=A0A1W5D7Z8_9LECA|nr:phosphate:h symporter [Lasallia pustulata]